MRNRAVIFSGKLSAVDDGTSMTALPVLANRNIRSASNHPTPMKQVVPTTRHRPAGQISRFGRPIALVATTVLLGFGSWGGVSVAENPAASSTAKPTVLKDLRYQTFRDGSDPGQGGLCDLTIPGGEPPENGFPVVIVTHGGGWISGDKWTMTSFNRELAKSGIAALTINYRLAPANLFPTRLDDLRAAMLWLTEQSERFNLNVQQIGLWGYSAGAQISLVAAAVANEPIQTRSWTTAWPADDRRWTNLPIVAAVVGGGSPCEFKTLPPANRSMAYWLGGSREELPEIYAAASPTSHLDRDDPPILLIHGTSDLIVPIRSARLMKAAAEQVGATCDVLELPGDGHVTTFTSRVGRKAAVEFLHRHLVPNAD